MFKQKLIFTVAFSALLLFASGADNNQLWVTALGVCIPLTILMTLTKGN